MRAIQIFYAVCLGTMLAACRPLTVVPSGSTEGPCTALISTRNVWCEVSAVNGNRETRKLGYTPLRVSVSPETEYFLVEAEYYYSQMIPARCGDIDIEMERIYPLDWDLENRNGGMGHSRDK